MNPVDGVSHADPDARRRAARRTLRQRRGRFWRRIVVSVAVTGVMVVAALANRDLQHWRQVRSEAAALVGRLQNYYERERELPLSIPARGPDGSPAPGASNYALNIFYAEQSRGSARVGVCCSKRPEWFFLRPSARVVITFDGSRFHAEIMPESRFRAEAARLGFQRLPEQGLL